MGTATSGVRDDGVEIFQIERIDQSACKVTGRFQFAIVGMERTATNLHLRRVDLAAISQKDIHCIAVHIRENDVLHATREHADAVTRRCRRFNWANDVTRKSGSCCWSLRFQIPEFLWQERIELERAKNPLRPAGLIEPESPADEAQEAWASEKPLQKNTANRIAARIVECTGFLDLRASDFKEVPILHAGWASSFAGQAAEAEIHLLTEGLSRIHFAIGNRPHERNASPRAVALHFCCIVGRTGRQTHAAVHALLENGVVEVFEPCVRWVRRSV